MNIAGPSRARPGRGTAAANGWAQSTYEDDLFHLLAELGPEGAEGLREFYDNRARTGQRLTDHELAMRFFLQNAMDLAAVEEDVALARLLAEGLDLEDNGRNNAGPSRAPQAIRPPDQRPQQNNNQTAAANGTPGNNPAATQTTQTWGEWLGSMFGGWFSTPQTTTTSTAADRGTDIQLCPAVNAAPARPTGHVCVICQDPIYGSEVQAPCGHYYDIGCVTDLFQSASRDESLYPPRCCRQNIPVAQVEPHMSRQLATEFREKGREFGTLNRVYCAQQTCSRFLGPLTEGPFGPATYDCPAPGCTTRTCARCRGRYDGWLHICRQDQGAEHVLNMGRTEGWARCPGCSQMIELNMGCYHMTCRCRTEFCYMCRARWKTCRCPQWDERRLLAVAEHRVDAQFGAPRRAQPAQQQQQPARPVAAVQPVAPRPVPVPLPRVAPAPPVPPRPQPAPVAPPRPLSAAQVHRLFQGQTQTPQAPVVQPRATQMNNGLEVHTPAVRTGAPVAGPSTSAARTSQLFGQTETTTRRNSWYEQMVASRETTPRVRMPPPIPPKPAGITNPSRAGIPSASVSKLTATTTQAQTTTQFPAQPATRTTPGIPRTLPVKPNKSQRRRAEDDTRGSGSGSGSGVGTQHDAVRQRMIREMMDRLRVDHDCDHIKWTYRRGGGRCENCYHELPLYLFRCHGCQMLVCNRCRRNRL